MDAAAADVWLMELDSAVHARPEPEATAAFGSVLDAAA
jgi:hypothetical protein